MADLRQMPQYEITTSTPWTERRHTYKGPRLADVLKASGAQGKQLLLEALNEYQVHINSDDILAYHPILALTMDNQTMRVRDKGPIWLMLPLDQFDKHQRASVGGYLVWQLRRIRVEQ